MYADDATQYVSGSSLKCVEEKLNTEIKPIVEWSDMNKMVLNKKKTKAMVVASSRKLLNLPKELSINIHSSTLSSVTTEKLLGVHIDSSLSWNMHVDSLCKKISQRLGIFRRIRHHLTFKARLAFCQCLILSLMDYCCVVWGNTSQQNLDRIHRLQKKTARLILNQDYKAPSLPLFLQLGWLPFHERVKFLRGVTVYKALNNLTPTYITNLIKPFNSVHKLNTRGADQKIVKIPMVTTNAGMRTFAFIGAKEWNSLPKDIRNASSISSFKKIYLNAKFNELKNYI